MKTYITMTERGTYDVFKGMSKPTVVMVSCSSLPAAFHVFYLATDTDKYSEVTLSTKEREVDGHAYDVAKMNSDEFILVNL